MAGQVPELVKTGLNINANDSELALAA